MHLSLPNSTTATLLYSLPAIAINRLQRVQNALARVVVPTVRWNHLITPTLKQLHWLPVSKRITFKIAALTFKTLFYKEPVYLADLLHAYTPSRSSDKNLYVLSDPVTKIY